MTFGRGVARAPAAVCALAALLAAGCGAQEQGEVEYRPVASVHDLMVAVVEPAAEVVWESVGTTVTREGRTDWAPRTDAEWEGVRLAAMMVAESGNLLLVEGRSGGREDWDALARGLIDAGLEAIAGAESRDPQAVFDTGAGIYDACLACHDRYLLEGL